MGLSYLEEMANKAACRGVTCENCIYFTKVDHDAYEKAAGECHAPYVLGPPYFIHPYRQISTVCTAYIKRPDISREKTQRDYGRAYIEQHGLYWRYDDERGE